MRKELSVWKIVVILLAGAVCGVGALTLEYIAVLQDQVDACRERAK